MKKYFFFIVIVFFSFLVFPQSSFSKFEKLSTPKKWWVIMHPFKAKKSLEISNRANAVTNKILKSKIIGSHRYGGKVDAFRHAFWMASLKIEIGESSSRSLGEAHEKENYQFFKENKLEDGAIPDKPSMDMDLHNNNVGLSLVSKNEVITEDALVKRVIEAINEGKMLIIKKDKKNRFLSCNNVIITKNELKGKWINSKCLIASNAGN